MRIFTITSLALAVFAAAGSSVYPAPRAPEPARYAQAAPEAAAPRAASDPVADKFRRLQREISSGDASSASADRPVAPPESVGVFSLSMKIFFGLIFVLILAVVAIRLLKRFQGRMLAKGGRAQGEILEVLETCHLGPHQRVVALRMNDEVGIVGVTQQGMSLLTMLKEPAEEIRKQNAGPGNPAAFSENLNKLLERFKRPKRVSDLLDEQP